MYKQKLWGMLDERDRNKFYIYRIVNPQKHFWTTLTGILDFANSVFQTDFFSQFKLEKKIKQDTYFKLENVKCR